MSDGKALLDRLLSSKTKGELLQLFHLNPGLVDTQEGVARRIGKTGNDIASAVNDFVDLGILQRRQIGTKQILRYNQGRDTEVQASIESYFRSLSK